MAAPTSLDLSTEAIRRLRDQLFSKTRGDSASPIHGYSRKFQGNERGSNLDAFHARQRGAAPDNTPGFQGMTGEDIAADLAAKGETTNVGGRGLRPNNPFAKPAVGGAEDKDAFGLPYGPNNPKPGAPAITDAAAMGRNMISGAGGGIGGAAASAAGNAGISALRQSVASSGPAASAVDPSTVRQPFVGKLDENSDTPAKLRQMVSDAAMGRATNTSGTPGLTRPSSIPVAGDPFKTGFRPMGQNNPFGPADRPMQAADFRRTITSKYGTGTNETRQPGQGPATTQDLVGRRVGLQDWLADQKAVQATKDKNGWIAAKPKKSEDDEEEQPVEQEDQLQA